MITFNEMKRVRKDEFEAFIAAYPSPLKTGISNICEPSTRDYFDESIKGTDGDGSYEKFHHQRVAKIQHWWLGPNGEVDKENHGKWWRYFIVDKTKTVALLSSAQAPTGDNKE